MGKKEKGGGEEGGKTWILTIFEIINASITCTRSNCICPVIFTLTGAIVLEQFCSKDIIMDESAMLLPAGFHNCVTNIFFFSLHPKYYNN